MDLYYIFPVPPVEDPVRWLKKTATELKWHQAGPQGWV